MRLLILVCGLVSSLFAQHDSRLGIQPKEVQHTRSIYRVISDPDAPSLSMHPLLLEEHEDHITIAVGFLESNLLYKITFHRFASNVHVSFEKKDAAYSERFKNSLHVKSKELRYKTHDLLVHVYHDDEQLNLKFTRPATNQYNQQEWVIPILEEGPIIDFEQQMQFLYPPPIHQK